MLRKSIGFYPKKNSVLDLFFCVTSKLKVNFDVIFLISI